MDNLTKLRKPRLECVNQNAQINDVSLFVQAYGDVLEVDIECNTLGLDAQNRFQRLEDDTLFCGLDICPNANANVGIQVQAVDDSQKIRLRTGKNQFIDGSFRID